MGLHLRRRIQSLKARFEQNSFDLSFLYSAKKIIVFLLPPRSVVSGGILSIFNICGTTRKLMNDAAVVLATFPSFDTYTKVDWFDNNEIIYRFSQIICHNIQADEVYIHIPEYISNKFYSKLSHKEKDILKNIKNLHINIMNQNIELMPDYEKIKDLFLITKNITQTTAHDRYSTQEICDRWKMPLLHIPAILPPVHVQPTPFDEKLKNIIIAFSNDKNEYKNKIYKKIINNVKNCSIITIQNMKYREYFEVISKSLCVVTFGEGFDAYFLQPFYYGSMGIAVYNDNFFPDEEWKKNKNVYLSFEDMEENIAHDINYFISNREEYYNIINRNREMNDAYYRKQIKVSTQSNSDKYTNNIQRFYRGDYDFLPSAK